MKKLYQVRCPEVPPGYKVIYSAKDNPDGWEAFAITDRPGWVHEWHPQFGWSAPSNPTNNLFWEWCIQWASEHEVVDEAVSLPCQGASTG